MSDSVRPRRQQPNRLLCPWDSPGKNTGVGCHFPLQCVKMKSESEVAQSCLTLSDPMDCSLSGSSVHGVFQARVLEWVAIAFSVRGPSVCHMPYAMLKSFSGTSLVVQWLRLHTSNAGSRGSIPGQGIKIPPGTAKKKKSFSVQSLSHI